MSHAGRAKELISNQEYEDLKKELKMTPEEEALVYRFMANFIQIAEEEFEKSQTPSKKDDV